jgi:hypothetical protein
VTTAIEQAAMNNPDMEPSRIIRYSCPHIYEVGVKPEWCEIRKVLGKTCRDCWEQEKGEV